MSGGCGRGDPTSGSRTGTAGPRSGRHCAPRTSRAPPGPAGSGRRCGPAPARGRARHRRRAARRGRARWRSRSSPGREVPWTPSSPQAVGRPCRSRPTPARAVPLRPGSDGIASLRREPAGVSPDEPSSPRLGPTSTPIGRDWIAATSRVPTVRARCPGRAVRRVGCLSHRGDETDLVAIESLRAPPPRSRRGSGTGRRPLATPAEHPWTSTCVRVVGLRDQLRDNGHGFWWTSADADAPILCSPGEC